MSNERRPCPECLQTSTCWVCQGQGRIEARGGSVLCRTCQGRGLCRSCRPVPAQRESSDVPSEV